MMKKFFVFMMALMAMGFAMAQEDVDINFAHSKAYHSDDSAVVRGKPGVGWVRAHLLDDWFYQLQGGGQLYFGTDDTKGPFFDHLTGNVEFQLGRRIFPMFGFRTGIGYGYAHGFLSKDLYYQDRSSLLGHGGSGVCGLDANGNSYGGYFYYYNDELLIQKWKYFYLGLDLFLDLDIFKGPETYDPDARWNHVVYAGVHNRYSLSDTDDKNHRTEGHVGYIFKYNVLPGWSFYLDTRASFIERLFDREWVSSVERSGFGLDFVFNVHLGVMYKFHIRTDELRNRFFVKSREDSRKDVAMHFSYVKMEETVEMHLIDTLMKYKVVNTPTPETNFIIDSLEKKINDNLNKNKEKVWNQPLDSIFINRLLPYEMVFFEKDKWDILPSEETKIEKMAIIMKAYPNEKFILTGSADLQTGTVSRNDFLSHCRADVVYNILVDQYDIDPEQLRRNYLGGIDSYKPFQLNRCTVIIMDHPKVWEAFEEMKQHAAMFQ